MKAMNRMLGSIKRKPGASSASSGRASDSGLDTPEANAARNVRLFCESGGPEGSGEEVLFLPTIVESCESSPQAAKDAAYIIRKFLSKDQSTKPYIQYNSIMLIRILADNPGKTFTRNVDDKFVQAVQNLLRNGRDPSVKQILMETLDTFQRQKAADEGLAKLIEMWKAEQERMVNIHGPAIAYPMQPGFDARSQNYFSRNHNSCHLPNPHELSSRIEEAKTSAQLLSQTVQSTPPSELLQNELVREFANRCQSASRSIQAYMVAENPGPDNDTMETLIETNEQLSKAMSQHQRAVLNARKAAGLGSGTPVPPVGQPSDFEPPARTESDFAAPPPGPPPGRVKVTQPTQIKRKQPPIPPPGDYAPVDGEDENPFSDPSERKSKTKTPPLPTDREPTISGQFNDRLGIEPYHPGFKETRSYVGRQGSAIDNTTMHAAVEAEPQPERSVGSERRREERRRDGDDEDAYSAPGSKPQIYRY